MSKAIDNLINATQYATTMRPKAGGFPVLAEVFRQAGVEQNMWFLPSCQSIYLTKDGDVVFQGTPLISEHADIALFNKETLIKAIRTDQVGQSTFPEFLQAVWDAGVVNYVVDFKKRTVTYNGVRNEQYIEEYPAVEIE